MLLILLLILSASCMTVHAANSGKTKTVRVRYFNTRGTKEYKGRKAVLKKNEKFTAPALRDTSSHVFLGWSKKKNSRKVSFTPEKKYTLKSDLKLYAVWKEKPKRTIRFYTRKGEKEYSSLRITRHVGETYRLPRLKDTKTYRFLGWAKKKSAVSAELFTGDKVTVSRNEKYYAVTIRKTDCYAKFVLSDGTVFQVARVDGRTVRFPAVVSGGRRTSQGWSTVRGRTCNPEYTIEEIVPKRNATYYSVDADNLNGTDDGNRIRESEKYLHTYFVGDSRIYLGSYYMRDEFSKTRLIARSGSGYTWLAEDGYQKLVNAIRKDNAAAAAEAEAAAAEAEEAQAAAEEAAGEAEEGNKEAEEAAEEAAEAAEEAAEAAEEAAEEAEEAENARKAVVFCSGVHDLQRVNDYISFYRKKAPELRELGCDVYVMSVNPFNSVQYCYTQRNFNGHPHYKESRSYEKLRTFNKKLEMELAGTCEYIDTYSYLMRTGWATYSIYSHKPDGLHYTKPITRRVFNYTADFLDR